MVQQRQHSIHVPRYPDVDLPSMRKSYLSSCRTVKACLTHLCVPPKPWHTVGAQELLESNSFKKPF